MKPLRIAQGTAVAAVLAAAIVVLVSRGGEGESVQLDPVTPEEAVAAVRGFRPAETVPIEDLNRIVASPGEVSDAVAPFLRDRDPVRRWAALYVITHRAVTREDGRVLVPLLDDDEETLRALAAASLARLGYVESLPVLIETLDSEALLPYQDPPRPLAANALERLRAVTRESFETAEEWRAWWSQNGERLEWNGETYVVA